ncbi:uncharacterized protein LOC144715849 [Wolffia australiana]
MESPPRAAMAGVATRSFGLDFVPCDVAITIASSLGARDLCSLGSCSRFWNRLCASDFLWSALFADRWPSSPNPRSVYGITEGSSSSTSSVQEVKGFYIRRHQEMELRFCAVINFVEKFSEEKSLEVSTFQKVVTDLHLMDAGFEDVKLFILSKKRSVLLNLIGLHYLIFFLQIPGFQLLEALQTSQISERMVCVNWFKLGRWLYGFRLPDESRSRKVTLSEFATSEDEVRAVLNRGVIHEVLRVQITALVSKALF